MPFKQFWNLAPDNSDNSILNMYVYGEICSASSFFGSDDNVVASKFVEDLNRFPNVRVINVHINSPGGSVFAAAAIRNQLRESSAEVHTWCDGICASAAVGILLAAEPANRHMSRATLLMIHNPSTKAQGDAATFIKTADLLAKVKKTILNIYVDGTGLSEEKLSTMMDESTYLDADESLAYNFVGHITEDPVVYNFGETDNLVCNGVSIDVAADLDIASLKAHLEQLTNKQNTSTTPILEKGGTEIMDFEAFLASLAEDQRSVLTVALEDKIQTAVNDKITTITAEHETATQELQDQITTLTEANNTLTGQITDLTAQQQALSAEDAIIKNMPPEAQALLAQARADAVAANAAAKQLQEAQAFATFKEAFNAFDKLPITDNHIKAMQSLSKNDEAMFNDMRELLKVANTAMGAGFVPKGSDQGSDVPSDTYALIEQRVATFRNENPTVAYNDALREVLKADPDLYNKYRDGIYN